MSKPFARLVDLGVTPDTPLDLAVIMRVGNVAAMLMAGVSLGGIGMTLGTTSSTMLALAIALCAAGYLCVVFLNGSGFFDAARFTFIVVGFCHYALLSLVLGPQLGFRFYLAAFVLFPAMAFLRNERRERAAAWGIVCTCFVLSEVLAHRFGPLVPTTPAAVEVGNYFIALSLATVVGCAMRYYQNLSQDARRQLDDANRRIGELLANVLPPLIAARLQEHQGIIADNHGDATVLFADLVGFSALTRRLSPGHLIEVLDLIFSRFDEAAAGHRIEKIKTIGDCYMAATGVLSEAEGAAAVEAVADFGLDLLTIVRATAAEIGLPLGVRIGISTGPVVSGVIGRHKYSFDVWGDTVNLASRMESGGLAGRIQVSEATFWRLQHVFDFETRGSVEVKGMGETPAYLLVGRKQGTAAAITTRSVD
jgi:class 3 adenylate cyclase